VNIVRNRRISVAARSRKGYANAVVLASRARFFGLDAVKRKNIKSLLNTKTIHGMVLKSRRPQEAP
jgi:hypothetical protein